MPQDEQRLRKPNGNNQNDSFSVIASNEPIAEDEFKSPDTSIDFWETHRIRFEKGLVKEPIVVERPKKTINLSKGEHYFEIENIEKRSIICVTCPAPHGGILESHLLTQYRLADGVLFFRGKPVNKTPQAKTV